MAVRRGKLDAFVAGDVMGVDDFVSLEAQTIQPVATRSALPASPDAGIFWIADKEELVGWDGSKWVTIIAGFEQPVVAAPELGDEDRVVLQGPVNAQTDNDYWQDPTVGQRVTARNVALAGVQTGAPNPLGLTATAQVELFDTATGGCAVWRQQAQIAQGTTATITAQADCDVQFLVVALGGSGAGGRNVFWSSDHPLYQAVMTAGGGGGGGEVRAVNLRLYKGQRVHLTGLSVNDGGAVRIVTGGGIVLAALPGASSVRAAPFSTFFTAVGGHIPKPEIPEATVPNAGASQWTQAVRFRDTIPATSTGITVAARYMMYYYKVNGGVTSGRSDNRYYPGAPFGYGGGHSQQPGWGRAGGSPSQEYATPAKLDTPKPWDQYTYESWGVAGSGGGGSMVSAGESAFTVSSAEPLDPGRPVTLDTDFWPAKYDKLAPGGYGINNRFINLSSNVQAPTPFRKGATSTAPGAGGNGGVGEGAIGSMASYPAEGGQYGLVMVRWSHAGTPLVPYTISYT